MPRGPSAPEYRPPPIQPPSPRMRTALLEEEKKAQAKSSRRRKGYQSTVLTHGLGLARTRQQEAKAFKLGE